MMTTELALPTDGDSAHWSEQERALVQAAGLVRTERRGQQQTDVLADRPTVEAFLAHCRRTGLDPIARQIYAIYRGGKWGIQISIDGARLVAERSGKYEGQTPTEWTDGTLTKVPLREDGKLVRDGAGNVIMVDDYLWVTAWVSNDYPKAARVGVRRNDFPEPLYATARWESYVVMKDVWAGGQKTGDQSVSDMWAKMPDLMLGKVAEMLALRKAFPQDLSGLYSTEEMQQAEKAPAGPPAAQRPAQSQEQVETVQRDWKAEIDSASTLDQLTVVANDAQALGIWDQLIDGPGDEQEPIGKALFRRKAELTPQTIVDVPAEKAKARNWLREARPMKTSEEVRALWHEAKAGGAGDGVLDELAAMEAALPTRRKEGEPAPAWAPVDEPSEFVEVEPGVFAEGPAAVLDDGEVAP